MKLLTLIFLLYLNSCMGQYPIQKAYWDSNMVYKPRSTIDGLDTIMIRKAEPDTLPVILLVCDTQAINGKTDTHVYWVKGYKVIEDFDTYYLDISKKRFGRSVIVWLDQNNLK